MHLPDDITRRDRVTTTTMPTSRRIISRVPVPQLQGWELRTVELTISPGPQPEHTHPRTGVCYIVEGEIHDQFDGGPLAIHKTGEVFLDLPDKVHTVINASETENAIVVVSYVIQVDEANVVPLPEDQP